MRPEARRAIPGRWHLARWSRAVPGRSGLVALAVAPGLFFAPYEWTGLFRAWQDVGSAVLVVGIVLASLGIARDLGTPDPTAIWLHQRGLSLADWAVARWVADIGLMLLVALWWTAWYALAAHGHGLPLSPRGAAAIAGWLIGTFIVISALMLVLGAIGRGRPLDAALLILILTALLPALEAFAPGPLVRSLGIIAPPLHALAELRGVVLLGNGVRHAILPLLHTVTWLLATVAIAVVLLRRRRPTAPSS
jgi:hypothetical protein